MLHQLAKEKRYYVELIIVLNKGQKWIWDLQTFGLGTKMKSNRIINGDIGILFFCYLFYASKTVNKYSNWFICIENCLNFAEWVISLQHLFLSTERLLISNFITVITHCGFMLWTHLGENLLDHFSRKNIMPCLFSLVCDTWYKSTVYMLIVLSKLSSFLFLILKFFAKGCLSQQNLANEVVTFFLCIFFLLKIDLSG